MTAPTPPPAPAADSAPGREAGNEARDAYELHYQDEAGYYCGHDIVRTRDGVEIAYDYGEPEDRTFTRDLKGIVPELNRLAAEVERLRGERDEERNFKLAAQDEASERGRRINENARLIQAALRDAAEQRARAYRAEKDAEDAREDAACMLGRAEAAESALAAAERSLEEARGALRELADLVDDHVENGGPLDTFTTQPARRVLPPAPEELEPLKDDTGCDI